MIDEVFRVEVVDLTVEVWMMNSRTCMRRAPQITEKQFNVFSPHPGRSNAIVKQRMRTHSNLINRRIRIGNRIRSLEESRVGARDSLEQQIETLLPVHGMFGGYQPGVSLVFSWFVG